MSDEKRMKPRRLQASSFHRPRACIYTLGCRHSVSPGKKEEATSRRDARRDQAQKSKEKAKRDARLGNCIQVEVLPQISLYLAQCWQPPSVASKAPKISRALAGFKEDLDGYMQTDTTDGFPRFKMRERQLDECSSLDHFVIITALGAH